MLFLTLPAAFLQLAFLPGFLILVLTGFHRENPGRIFFFSALLSGIFNMIAAYLLFAAGCFHPAAVRILFILELLLLLILLRFNNPFRNGPASGFNEIREIFLSGTRPEKILLIFAGSVIAWAAWKTLGSAFEIFRNWDAVLSWNRWAAEWASGKFPDSTRGYPQLIPLNWAISYLLCGAQLEYIPHLTCHYLEFLTLLGIFELGCSRKQPGLFAAVIICAFFFRNLTVCRDGSEADLYLIFYAFSAIYLLFLLKEDQKWLPLAMIAAAGLTAVKQSGLLIWFLYPIPLALISPAFHWKKAILYLIIGIIAAAPYYTIFSSRCLQGKEYTNISYMTCGIYGDHSPAERGIAAAKMFFCKLAGGMEHCVETPRYAKFSDSKCRAVSYLCYLGKYSLFIFAAFLIFLFAFSSLKEKLWKYLILFWGIPFFIAWSFSFCYDLRNLGAVIPLFSCGLGIGLLELSRRKHGKKILTVLLLFLISGVAAALRDSNFLAEREHLARKIGNPVLNEILLKTGLPGGFIATDYEFLKFLKHDPPFRLRYIEYSNPDPEWFRQHRKAVNDQEIKAILIPDYAAECYRNDIENIIRTGNFSPAFQMAGYLLLIRRGLHE